MKKMEEELAAVSLRLRVELDWVEERLSCQWASALDDYYRLAIFFLCFGVASDLSALHNFLLYRRSQESFEEAWVMMAVEELPLNGSLALYQAD